jgi:hypothetical protein
MTSDRELLEAAARAAGMRVRYVGNGTPNDNGALFTEPDSLWWNPLVDDGDALRLAVKLGMHVGPGCAEVWRNGREVVNIFSDEPDEYAATRRAIVRAAAAMAQAHQ